MPKKSIAHERKVTFYPPEKYKWLLQALSTINNVPTSEQILHILEAHFDKLSPAELKVIQDRAKILRDSPETLDNLRKIRGIPIKEIITGETGIILKRSNLLDKCPICGSMTSKHDDFTFYISNQTFACLSCNSGGTGVEFIMKLKSLSLGNAVDYIAQKYLQP